MKPAPACAPEPAPEEEVDLRRQVAFLFAGVRCLEGGSVSPGCGAVGKCWLTWLSEVYRLKVRHCMRGVYLAAESRRIDGVFREDRELSCWDGWPPGSREGSLVLGRSLLAARPDLRGERLGPRLRLGIATGMADGHASVVFAVHAAIYGIPLWVSLIGYLFLEWRLALGAHEAESGALDRFLDENVHSGLLTETQQFLHGEGLGLRVV